MSYKCVNCERVLDVGEDYNFVHGKIVCLVCINNDEEKINKELLKEETLKNYGSLRKEYNNLEQSYNDLLKDHLELQELYNALREDDKDESDDDKEKMQKVPRPKIQPKKK